MHVKYTITNCLKCAFLAVKVVNLLLELALAAAVSLRREDVFDPRPTIVNPTDPTSLAFTEEFSVCNFALEYSVACSCIMV